MPDGSFQVLVALFPPTRMMDDRPSSNIYLHVTGGVAVRFVCREFNANHTIRTSHTDSAGLGRFLPQLLTMSLLQPSLRILARPTASRAVVSARLLNTETTKTPTTTESNANIVPEVPTRDVVSADAVSGAPRTHLFSQEYV